MIIDSGGNVGIGTDSPLSRFTVQADASANSINIVGRSGGQNEGWLFWYQNNGTTLNSGILGDNQGLKFATGSSNTEAMRIDSSGNLLVGRTSANNYNSAAGFEVQSSGLLANTRDGGIVQIMNRLTSDGDIAVFRKDGTTVGSIGSEGGDALYIQGGTTSGSGLHMHPTAGNINPARNGVKVDAAIDLGRSTHRFKDLYLAGGVYLGGTGSANLLDDYEEGVFNVELWAGGTQLALSQYGGSYVKVGNLVSINFEADCSNTNGASGPLEVRGMPFTVADVLSPTGIEANGSVSYWQQWSTTINSPSVYAEGGTTTLYVMGCTTSTVASNANLTAANIGTGEFRGSITYRTT